MAEASRHFTVASLAEHWQVSTTHVYNLIASGRLGHLRIGSAIRIRRQDVEAFEAKAWHAPGATDQPSSSPTAADVMLLSFGGRDARTAFRRAQRMSRPQCAS
jgi:excisionase family DNA binding protein